MSKPRGRSALTALMSVAVLLAPAAVTAGAAPAHTRSGAITSVAPRVERAGRTAVITGTGFHGVRSVRFHGRPARFRVVSSHRIQARVPATATTGLVTVATAAGTLTSPHPLVVAPTLTSFTPTSGSIGTLVTISGTGFTSPATVSFNGANATGTVVSATTITVYVPWTTATTGPLKVTTAGSTLTGGTFTVTAGIALSTATGPPTSSITISGAGFAAHEPLDLYAGTTDVALVSTSGTGSFTATGFQIPATAQPGTLQITAIGRHSGVSAQTPFTVRTDWAQFGGGTAIRGANPYENTINVNNAGSLDRDWSVNVGGANGGAAVVGGIAYVGSLATGSNNGVHAVNATTGATIWHYAFGSTDQVFVTPAVVGGVVYVTTYAGELYALNAATGTLKWKVALTNEAVSSPEVVNGVVYVGAGDYLFAVNAATGANLWSFMTSALVYGAPAIVNGRVYLTSLNDSVYALNATTGADIWTSRTSLGIEAAPVVVGGIVYVGSEDDYMYAFNASTGDEIWTFEAAGEIIDPPAVVNNVLYFVDLDTDIYAINATTGTAIWSETPADIVGSGYLEGVTAADGVLYLGTYSGRVIAVDATYGGIVGNYTTGGAINSAPVIVNGVLYAGSTDGSLYALDLAGGLNPNVAHRVDPGSLHPNRHLMLSPAGPGS